MVVFFLVYDILCLNYIAIKLYKKISDRNFRRFLGRATLSHTTLILNDSYGALRYRPPNIPKQRLHTTPILNELLAAALRYRTPKSLNSELTSQHLRDRNTIKC
ncbi:MAG: hypothetical protein ACKPGB_25710 [Dolichospermum sp.]